MRTPGKGSSMVQAPPTRGTALDDEDALAGAGEIGGAGEAVVAGADDDDVPGAVGEGANGSGKSDFTEDGGGGRGGHGFKVAFLRQILCGIRDPLASASRWRGSKWQARQPWPPRLFP